MLKCSRGEATCPRLVTARPEREDRCFYWDFSNIRRTPHPHLNGIYESPERGDRSNTLNTNLSKTVRKILKQAITQSLYCSLTSVWSIGIWTNIAPGSGYKTTRDPACSLEPSTPRRVLFFLLHHYWNYYMFLLTSPILPVISQKNRLFNPDLR